jgi:hypothetical protein
MWPFMPEVTLGDGQNNKQIPATLVEGFYPASLSTTANFKVGLVWSSSFHYAELFLDQHLLTLALFVIYVMLWLRVRLLGRPIGYEGIFIWKSLVCPHFRTLTSD